jgi:hypothetical protein
MGVAVQSGLKIEFREFATDGDSSTTRSLGEQEAHIWHAPLHSTSPHVPRLLPLLSENESKRARRFRFEKNRNEFILSRGWLRILSASYLVVSPAELGFAYSPHGKPYLSTPARAQSLAFSVSHTEGMVLFAFTWSRKVGIDIENVRRDFNAPEIAERFFSVAGSQPSNSTRPSFAAAGRIRRHTSKPEGKVFLIPCMSLMFLSLRAKRPPCWPRDPTLRKQAAGCSVIYRLLRVTQLRWRLRRIPPLLCHHSSSTLIDSQS